MAFHKSVLANKSLENMRSVSSQFSAEERLRIINEARAIEQEKLHFLLSLNDGGCSVNGEVTDCPTIGSLMKNVIREDESLVIANNEQAQFSRMLASLIDDTRGSVSDVFLHEGVRIIPSTALPFRLSGGSFAGVDLYMNGKQQWKVHKFINQRQCDEDADIRLAREGVFIRDLPAAPKSMFPYVGPQDVILTDDQVGYHMDYCPHPTMAESLFGNQCDGKQIVDALANIYEHMFRDMYTLPQPENEQDDSYFERIDRRFERIMQTPESMGPKLKKIMSRENLCINGQQHKGVIPLYEHIKQNEEFRRLACSPDHSLCHGDMILEDILFQPLNSSIQTVDRIANIMT